MALAALALVVFGAYDSYPYGYRYTIFYVVAIGKVSCLFSLRSD